MKKARSSFIKENIAPKGADRILIFNSENEYMGYVKLEGLRQLRSVANYSFELISDIHVSYNTASEDLQRALDYADNSDCLFTIALGDLTGNGTDEEMQAYKDIVDSYSKPVYAISGNHETIWGYMTDDRMITYTGHPLYYAFEQGDDVFIMMGHYGPYKGDGIGWLSSEFISTKQLQWLYETLEENRNKRCFVFNHVYPYESGVGDAGRYYNNKNWSETDGAIGQAYIELLKHYKNTILFHGHSHLKLYLQEIDKKANYLSDMGYRSVHVPSLSVPRDKVDGTLSSVYAESEGYIIDVYDNYIILNGRDFIDNEKDGHEIPIATYKIDTTLIEIEANTFRDSTGTINV